MRRPAWFCREVMGIVSEEIIASGGASASPVWLRMQADILGKAVRVCKVKEQACLGACILAGTGTGLFENMKEACGKFVEYDEKIYLPNQKMAEEYQKYHEKFHRLYEKNQDLF